MELKGSDLTTVIYIHKILKLYRYLFCAKNDETVTVHGNINTATRKIQRHNREDHF